MKKIFFSLAAILLVSFSSLAQKTDSVIVLPEIKVTAISKVNKQIEKAFEKAFPDAVKIRWYKTNKDYLTKFISDEMRHSAYFQRNGYLKYDISYGFKSNLPDQISQEIKTTYPDFIINRVANVKEAQRDIWIINLESLKHYVIARSENGEVEEVERFERSE